MAEEAQTNKLTARKEEITEQFEHLEKRRAVDFEELLRLQGEHRLISSLLKDEEAAKQSGEEQPDAA